MKEIQYIQQPTEYLCGQACVAMIANVSVEVHHDPVDHIYLDDFSVTAAYRNKGIGSALIRAAEEYAGQIGSRAVLLHVEKANTSAMRFYERYGYSVFRDDGHRFVLKKGIHLSCLP